MVYVTFKKKMINRFIYNIFSSVQSIVKYFMVSYITTLLKIPISLSILDSFSIGSFFDQRQPGPIKLVLLVIIGWRVGWLVGNAVFSEMTVRIFLIFCMKFGKYKSRKVTEPNFWKKFLTWRYSWKGIQINPRSDTLIFFSKTAGTICLVFGLRLVLNMIFNLNETYFSEKFSIWRYLTPKLLKNFPNWGF